MNRYILGQSVKIRGTFKDDDEVLTNPTLISLKIGFMDNNSSFTELADLDKADLTQESTGVFSYNYLTDDEGKHTVRMVSSGNLLTAQESEFVVNNSPFV